MAPLPRVRKRADYHNVQPGDLTFALFHDRILGQQARALSPHDDLPGFGRAYKMSMEGDILTMLNAQITRERFAEASYTAIATWAAAQTYPGLESWATTAAADERAHARRQIDYLNKRAAVVLEPLPAPKASFESYADALTTAQALERVVSAALSGIARKARDAGDVATAQFIETFLPEQVDAEDELRRLLQQITSGEPLRLLDAEIYDGADG